MPVRHYLKVTDLNRDETQTLIRNARENKGDYARLLRGKSLGLIFSKPSTRTRVSFTVAIHQLGGYAVFLPETELQLGRGETIEDTARVLSGYLDTVVIRTYSQKDLEQFAAAATVPVINGLTDERHPCQALADVMTMSEFHRDLSQVKVVYLGDGNNVATSLAAMCAYMGANVTLCTPPSLAPPQWALDEAAALAKNTGAAVELSHEPYKAVVGADFLYTDVWFSMGQESVPAKKAELEPFSIDEYLLSAAKPDCRVMHCLPAHRGEEVSAKVMDGPQSVVYQQAENRLHVQKELLKKLMTDAEV